MTDQPEPAAHLTPSAFHQAEGVEKRRVIGEGAGTFFLTGSFAAGARTHFVRGGDNTGDGSEQ